MHKGISTFKFTSKTNLNVIKFHFDDSNDTKHHFDDSNDTKQHHSDDSNDTKQH